MDSARCPRHERYITDRVPVGVLLWGYPKRSIIQSGLNIFPDPPKKNSPSRGGGRSKSQNGIREILIRKGFLEKSTLAGSGERERDMGKKEGLKGLLGAI